MVCGLDLLWLSKLAALKLSVMHERTRATGGGADKLGEKRIRGWSCTEKFVNKVVQLWDISSLACGVVGPIKKTWVDCGQSEG